MRRIVAAAKPSSGPCQHESKRRLPCGAPRQRPGEPRQDGPPLSFIPLVVTGQTALPWNPAVHQRTTERLGGLAELSQDSCTSVALITHKDLMILEHAASLGHDIIELLRSWRQSNPGSPLDQYLHQRGVPPSSPK